MLFEEGIVRAFLLSSLSDVVWSEHEKAFKAVCPDAPNAELDLLLENVEVRFRCWRRHAKEEVLLLLLLLIYFFKG